MRSPSREALELFKLPRKLGVTAAGEEITTNVGRFGPYVKYGAKYVSLKIDDPYTITPERALEVIREKEIADANRLILDFPEAGIQVLNGRYGPYITDKARNAKIPKDRDPKSLDACRMPGAARGGAAAQLRQMGPQGAPRPAPRRRQGRRPGRRRPRQRTATAAGTAKAWRARRAKPQGRGQEKPPRRRRCAASGRRRSRRARRRRKRTGEGSQTEGHDR